MHIETRSKMPLIESRNVIGPLPSLVSPPFLPKHGLHQENFSIDAWMTNGPPTRA